MSRRDRMVVGADLLLDRAPRLVALVGGGEARARLHRAERLARDVLQAEAHDRGDEVMALMRAVHDPVRLQLAHAQLRRRVVAPAARRGHGGQEECHAADSAHHLDSNVPAPRH